MSQLEGPEAASLHQDNFQGLRKGIEFKEGGKEFPSSLHSGFRGVEE